MNESMNKQTENTNFTITQRNNAALRQDSLASKIALRYCIHWRTFSPNATTATAAAHLPRSGGFLCSNYRDQQHCIVLGFTVQPVCQLDLLHRGTGFLGYIPQASSTLSA